MLSRSTKRMPCHHVPPMSNWRSDDCGFISGAGLASQIYTTSQLQRPAADQSLT